MANLNVIDTLVTRLQFQGAAEFSRQILGLGKNFDYLEEKLAKAKDALANVGDASNLQTLDKQLQKATTAAATAGTGQKFGKMAEDIAASRTELDLLNKGLLQTPQLNRLQNRIGQAGMNVSTENSKESIIAAKSSLSKLQADIVVTEELDKRLKASRAADAQMFQSEIKKREQILSQVTSTTYGRGQLDPISLEMQKKAQAEIASLKNQDINSYVSSNLQSMEYATRNKTNRTQIESLQTGELATLNTLEQKKLDLETQLGNKRLEMRTKMTTKLMEMEAAQDAAINLEKGSANAAQLEAQAAYNAAYLEQVRLRNTAVLAAEEELAIKRAALTKNLLVAGIILGLTALAALEIAAVKTAASFESLRIELGTLYKDAKKGNEAFLWAEEFASRTPQNVKEVVEGMKAMVAFGINPTEKRMRDLAGAAKLFHKDFAETIKAVAQGSLGHFKSLNDSIKLTKNEVNAMSGKQIFNDRGQPNDKVEAQTAILETIHKKYGTAIKDLEGGTENVLSNIGDAWTRLLDTIGQMGMRFIKDYGPNIIQALNWTNTIIKWINVGFSMFVLHIQAVATALVELLNVVSQLSFIFKPLRWLGDTILHSMGLNTLDQMAKKGWQNTQKAAQGMRDAYNFATGKAPLMPPSIKEGGEGNQQGSQMERLIQAVIGGGEIAQRGIKATEMPGATLRYNDHTYRVRLEGEGGQKLEGAVVALFEQFLNQIARGGGFHPPANAYGAP